MECNEPHLTRGEKNSTFYFKGVVYRQKKSFASFFTKLIIKKIRDSFLNPVFSVYTKLCIVPKIIWDTPEGVSHTLIYALLFFVLEGANLLQHDLGVSFKLLYLTLHLCYQAIAALA